MNKLRYELGALKQLRNDNSIVIVPADKGRSTVILDFNVYTEKMEHILTYASTYKPVQKSAVSKLIKNINTTVDRLRDVERITPEQAFLLRANDTGHPYIYGLPKVHEDGLPSRPIVSLFTSIDMQYAVSIIEKEISTNPSTGGTLTNIDPIEFLEAWFSNGNAINRHIEFDPIYET